MPQPNTHHSSSSVYNAIIARLEKDQRHCGNIRTFLIMAENARAEGNHPLAKKHLRKALDFEFEMYAETPNVGALADQWYPGEEI